MTNPLLLLKIINSINNSKKLKNNDDSTNTNIVDVNDSYKLVLKTMNIREEIMNKYLVDTDFFENSDFKNKNNVFDKINKTNTLFGKEE